MIRACVLVGLPGSGKTTVGRVLAQELGWSFVDVDELIVQQTGRSIAEQFAGGGEVEFRAAELRLTAELSSRAGTVVAPGGGWAAQPGALESLAPGAATVWLRIDPAEAIRRLGGSPLQGRPLLAGPDPLRKMRELLAQRTDHYARADHIEDVDGRGAQDISRTIIEWLRRSTS